MKIAVLDNDIVANLAALKGIAYNTLNTGDQKYLDGTLYEWFENSTNGISPDDIPANTPGRWVDRGAATSLMYVVADNYDFNGNSATDITDDDTNTILNFAAYGPALVGKYTDFKDTFVITTDITVSTENLAGANWVNYAGLSAAIRTQASIYIPKLIVENVSLAQLVTDCGGSSDLANTRLLNAQKTNEIARTKRYEELYNYMYEKLQREDALKAENTIMANSMRDKYVLRNRLRVANENVEGLCDYIEANGSFAASGLQFELDEGNLTIKDATTIPNFISYCTGIIENGSY